MNNQIIFSIILIVIFGIIFLLNYLSKQPDGFTSTIDWPVQFGTVLLTSVL